MFSYENSAYARKDKIIDEALSDSSGISLSFNTEKSTEKFLSSAKQRLKQIAENHEEFEFHDGTRSNFHQGQSRQSFSCFFPKLESRSRLARKGNFRSLVSFCKYSKLYLLRILPKFKFN